MKNYYKVGYGNPCPSDVLPTVLLYEPATKILWEHCGFCRRSWKATLKPSGKMAKRISKLDAIAKSRERAFWSGKTKGVSR